MNGNIEERVFCRMFRNGETAEEKRAVLREHMLTILVNEQKAFRLVCTKSDLKELVAGRLFTEGIIKGRDDIERLILCRTQNEASVFLSHEVEWEEAGSFTGSCCSNNVSFVKAKGRREGAPQALSARRPEPDRVFYLADRFYEDTLLHKKTRGTHSCLLAGDRELLYTCEDIGRHNAVDKAAGYALLHDIDPGECMLFTSGRVPLDMVEKVIAAGIPVLISKSVPTKESVEAAEKHGLTLIWGVTKDSCMLS